MKDRFFLLAILLACLSSGIADGPDPLRPSYPEIPPSYEALSPGRQIVGAKVNFNAVEIVKTDGYRVIDPDGNTFIVDNIEQPDCAFYATYINTNNGESADLEVISNVYIEELNLERCR